MAFLYALWREAAEDSEAGEGNGREFLKFLYALRHEAGRDFSGNPCPEKWTLVFLYALRRDVDWTQRSPGTAVTDTASGFYTPYGVRSAGPGGRFRACAL